MNRAAIYNELERKFLSTFIGELFPGVLHNFANPLNGIMGRSKLLQRRYKDFLGRMEERTPGYAGQLGEEKIGKDIDAIVSEAERFLTVFRDLEGKFSNIAARETERINLSQMIEVEVRFHDFYLDFKHDLKKNFRLEVNLPDIIGLTADYSLCISTLILSSKDRMHNAPAKEITIVTSHDAEYVSVEIQDSGFAISAACEQIAGAGGEMAPDLDVASLSEVDRGVCQALLLLKYNGARVQVHGEDGCNRFFISIPYR